MMRSARPPTIAWLECLHDPHPVRHWSLAEWQWVIRIGRRLRLLARLAEAIDGAGLDDGLPECVRQHLTAERNRSRARVRALRWTMEQLDLTLRVLPVQRVLLKGAAYIAQDLPVAAGRLPSDLDIMIAQASIGDARQRLLDDEWFEAELTEHDQRYYREWSHELPPMHNARFEVELDLHHGIQPPLARSAIEPGLLFGRCIPSGLPGWQVLCPVDQVIHSAVHLFADSDLGDRLRDLVDLDGLMRHFGSKPGFWPDLVERSNELRVGQVMELATTFTTRWLDTPIPADARRRLLAPTSASPVNPLTRALFEQVLTPRDPDAPPGGTSVAAALLLARYHLRRLPLHLLVPHLWNKALRRMGGPRG